MISINKSLLYFLCTCFIAFTIGFFTGKSTCSTNIPVVNIATQGTAPVPKETIKESLGTAGVQVSSNTANSIAKKIEATVPTAVKTTNAKLSTTEVKKLVATTTPQATSVITTNPDKYTTNVYAIDASKKAQHGLGIYAGNTFKVNEFECGISYRNKRLTYQAGYTSSHKYNIRLGYELAQW